MAAQDLGLTGIGFGSSGCCSLSSERSMGKESHFDPLGFSPIVKTERDAECLDLSITTDTFANTLSSTTQYPGFSRSIARANSFGCRVLLTGATTPPAHHTACATRMYSMHDDAEIATIWPCWNCSCWRSWYAVRRICWWKAPYVTVLPVYASS